MSMAEELLNDEEVFESLALGDELAEVSAMGYTDVEVAAILGMSLLKKTISQQDEILSLTAIIEERDLQITHLEKGISCIKSLEENHAKMMSDTETELTRVRVLNERYTTELQQSRTKSQRINEEIEALRNVLKDLESQNAELNLKTKLDLPLRRRCLLCRYVAEQENFYKARLDRMSISLAHANNSRVFLEMDYYSILREKKRLHEKLDDLQKELETVSQCVDLSKITSPTKDDVSFGTTSSLSIKKSSDSKEESKDTIPDFTQESPTATNKSLPRCRVCILKRMAKESNVCELFRRLTQFVRYKLTKK